MLLGRLCFPSWSLSFILLLKVVHPDIVKVATQDRALRGSRIDLPAIRPTLAHLDLPNYMVIKKEQLTTKDASRSFFRLVKAFKTPEKPQTFDVRSLRPGLSDGQVAEELADFFNRISAEFDPLRKGNIPVARDRRIPPLTLHEVAARIKKFRKPKSMVVGDVFPDLVATFADFFAIPLTSIFNEILRTYQWPLDWKSEYVTVIPKKSCPQ